MFKKFPPQIGQGATRMKTDNDVDTIG